MCTSNDHESWVRTESEQELGQGWLVLDWLLAYPIAHREVPDFGACKTIVIDVQTGNEVLSHRWHMDCYVIVTISNCLATILGLHVSYRFSHCPSHRQPF